MEEIIDQKVSQKTGHLLKSKGFDQGMHLTNTVNNEIWLHELPTQSTVQKWLRERHQIHIEILLEDDNPYTKFYYRLMKLGNYFTLSHHGLVSLNYEEVLEEALQEALKELSFI